ILIKNCSEISPHWTIDRGNAIIGNTPKISMTHRVAKNNDSPEFPFFHDVTLAGFILFTCNAAVLRHTMFVVRIWTGFRHGAHRTTAPR
ncbi:hypothetical protein ALC57_03544, partial [Trachymyrmex cornetzi]